MERELADRVVTHPMIDGFTDEHLIVRAGVDGAGGCPHLYQIYRANGTNEEKNEPICEIRLQEGHPKEIGVNGIGSQTLLLVVWDFMKKANAGEFPSRETSVVITKIEEAMQWIKQRELDRKSRGVWQTYKK